MAAEFGRVGSAYVDLEARVDRFERDLAQARGVLAREQRRMQQDANQTAGVFAGLNQQFGLIRAAAGTIVAAQATQRLIGYGDAWRSISAQLERSVGSADAARVAQEQLFGSAQRAGVEFAAVTNLFVSTNRAAGTLGATLDEVTTFTEAVTNSMAGATGGADAMSGALQQLSQLLFSPVVQMEEFRSILDGVPGLAVAAARGLHQIGVTADDSVASMFALAASGKLLSRDFFRAIVQQAPELAREMTAAADTTSKAMTRIQNALLQSVGAADQQAGATSRLTEALNSLASALESPAFSGFVQAFLVGGAKLMELQIKYLGAIYRDASELVELASPLWTENLNEDLIEAQGHFDELLKKRDELRATGDAEAIGAINEELAGALAQVNDLKRQVAERAAVAGAQGEAPGGAGPPVRVPGVPKPAPAGGPVGPSAADQAAQRAAERIRDTVEALRFEEAQLQRNASEQAVYNALKAAGVEATSDAGGQIRRLVEDIAALTQAEALRDLELNFRIAGLDESEQQVARILHDLELLRGIEGGRVVVDVDDQGTVDLLRERLREAMEREYRADLDTTQFETQIATMEQSAAEAARRLRELGIIQDVSDLQRPEAAAKFGELTRANEERARVEEARRELDALNRATIEGQQNSIQLGQAFGSAFEEAAFEVRDANGALETMLGLLEDVNRLLFRQFITAPLVEGIAAGLQGFFPSAFGARAARGAVVGSARGSVVRHPKYFAYGGYTGYMSERYPEAIMPLSQTTGGLGVRALPPDMSPVTDAAAALQRAAGALAQGGAGRGRMPEVRVFNNVGGAEARVQQGQDSSGMPTLDVIFDSQMQAAQRTRRLDRHLAPYGARRAPTRR